MKLIGVTGKSGAGKTTFSNMLAEKSNIGVIHIDEILTEIKLKYFKLFMKNNNKGEKIKVDSKLKIFIYKNKLLFNTFMKIRARLIKKPLEERIKSLQASGKEYALIDDVFIKHLNVYKDLSKIFIIERPYAVRKEALKERDDLTKEEIVANDIAHYKGNYKEIVLKNNIEKIENNGTEKELRIKANNIYTKHFVTFKDKYKQNVSNVEKSNDKTNESQKNKKKIKDEEINK